MATVSEEEKRLHISLSPDEAIVFFDWLSRMNESEKLNFVHPAEQRVLWDIESNLEGELTEPFRSDYVELLDAARARVADSIEQSP